MPKDPIRVIAELWCRGRLGFPCNYGRVGSWAISKACSVCKGTGVRFPELSTECWSCDNDQPHYWGNCQNCRIPDVTLGKLLHIAEESWQVRFWLMADGDRRVDFYDRATGEGPRDAYRKFAPTYEEALAAAIVAALEAPDA